MKNIITITVAIIAIIMAITAVILKPVRNIDYEPTDVENVVSKTTTTTTTKETSNDIATETKLFVETTNGDDTTKVELKSTESTKINSKSEETTKKKYESKIVSLIEKEVSKKHTEQTSNSYKMTPAEFRRAGVVYYNGYKFTYYSERVLPGKGLRIPGRHSDGNFVCDENNYICVASSDLPKGTVVDTPFGKGKVYDTGCPSNVIDVYVSW